MPRPSAGIPIRPIGPKDATTLNALAETDNIFDDDPAVAPSGAVTPDGARDFPADPTVPFWLAAGSGEYLCGRFLPEMRFR
ncbi:hypothetical protein [Arthrobacter sp. ISL-28]|uniref:hypothetical protein n=1 Tax=Arthrobacter sp. ISL-28 TaxID=2819108 RepID=UPI001BE8996C|nr:hypothetical protein [Arthrobacter sp. ISL-28]MBT2520743.1 hypothetical protein [Arthrobacter sp. ISL-28]